MGNVQVSLKKIYVESQVTLSDKTTIFMCNWYERCEIKYSKLFSDIVFYTYVHYTSFSFTCENLQTID